MPHLQGVPVQSRAIISRDNRLRNRRDNIAIAGRFSRVKNAKAISKVKLANFKSRKRFLIKGGVIRLPNRAVPK